MDNVVSNQMDKPVELLVDNPEAKAMNDQGAKPVDKPEATVVDETV